MQKLKRFDFAAKQAKAGPATLALAGALLAAGVWAGGTWLQADELRADVEHLQQRIEQRERALDVAKRAAQGASPDDKKFDAVLREQAGAHARLPVLDVVESAWAPQIALLSLSVQRAGKEATIEAEAQDLVQVYAFIERLRLAAGRIADAARNSPPPAEPGGKNAKAAKAPSSAQVVLVRHGIKPKDPNRAVSFGVRIELP
ncbi:hypothetical protein [Trinickia mobilis]|uniref:hypothetical protein n=1 Tax=Trinickia mobilis TaxID=2816356 RepID=UPI001A8E6B20|nr:hypothetical protein [Trinickia mobilis]